ncbi:hypothetical protein J41TS4_23770 [Paenibacillus apis]|uniref:Uncharacterized protein n=1 Tax=Paenibacillus apis TaxID=1792174 RepID=A0A919Y121_9BACL|nr:hypothetical protein J41TS4_23770 [Paenibacillus apis]
MSAEKFLLKYVFKKSAFQHREGCENPKKEERSVGKTYMSTGLRG